MDPSSPPFTPIKQTLDYSVLDQDEELFCWQQDNDPAQIIGPDTSTFNWPSPDIRRQLAQQYGLSPGQYFQIKSQRMGALDENMTPNKRPSFYSPDNKKILETPVHNRHHYKRS